MKRVHKSKKGFSLVEIVLVIAVIAILATVFLSGGLKILNTVKVLAYGEEATSVSINK